MTGSGADDPPPRGASIRRAPRPRARLTIGAMAILLVGEAAALAIFLPELREGSGSFSAIGDRFHLVAGILLGGPSLLGVPWLLTRKVRRPGPDQGRWGPGRLHWFAHGSAAWLLWPPIVIRKAAITYGQGAGELRDAAGLSQICYFYGTPLMGLYMILALAAGGSLRRRRLRRADWFERFGLLLGLLWALLGIEVLVLVYRGALR